MELTDQIADLVVELPPALIEEIADALQAHPGPQAEVDVAVSHVIAQPRARTLALELCSNWQQTAADVPGAAVALALRSAAAAARTIRGAQTVELVWSGPRTAISMRRTREALRDICRHAQRTLVLVSFSAYRDDGIIDELTVAADRGVDLTLILETTANSRGGLTREASDAFDTLHQRAAFYSWPESNRVAGMSSLLHAKTAVADRHAALISSANLSAAGMDRNMELGVLIVGEPLPALLEAHIRGLIDDAHLARIYP